MEERSATDLFAQYLDAKERGKNPDFEALCAAHPEFAATLRARHSEQQRMEAALQREKTILSAAGGDPSRWREYVEKLGKLGPPATRYVRGAELNSGGMGAIHRVADPLLERRLVVKLMHGDASADAARDPTPRSDDKSLGRWCGRRLACCRRLVEGGPRLQLLRSHGHRSIRGPPPRRSRCPLRFPDEGGLPGMRSSANAAPLPPREEAVGDAERRLRERDAS